MKAAIETVIGTLIICDIDIAESPMGIIRKSYEDDAAAAAQIFSNQTAIDQFMDGHIREERVAFDLLCLDGDSIRADWKMPLSNQPRIMEELNRFASEGQMPIFIVSTRNYSVA